MGEEMVDASTITMTHPRSEVDFQRLINGDTDRLVSRTSNLLQNKSFTDVTFIVGPASHSKKYVGHRVLLAMTSPVFEAMFYGDMSGGGETAGGLAGQRKVIRIPDLAPIGFENLLRYAYTDSLNLNSVEDAMLTAYAAKKYLLPHLLRECLNFVDKNVGPASACSVLEFAHVLNSHQLTFQALQVIDRNTYQVLGHKSLTGIQASTLATISSRRYLNLYSESSLVSAAVAWAAAESKRRSLDPHDFSTIRSILQDAAVLKNLRFLSLTPEEMAKVIVSTTGHESAGGHFGTVNGHRQGEAGGDAAAESDSTTGEATGNNSLLTQREQVALFMNIAVAGIRSVPKSLSPESRMRTAPPEHFVVKRYGNRPMGQVFATATSLSVVQQQQQQFSDKSSSAAVKAAACKFQINDSAVDLIFITGAVIPIRLDPAFYSVRTPRLDVSLRFTSKPGILSAGTADTAMTRSEEPVVLESFAGGGGGGGGSDGTSGSQLTASLSKDKDCVLRLKRPLVVRRGNLCEIVLSLAPSSAHMSEELVVLRSRNQQQQDHHHQHHTRTRSQGGGGGKGGGTGGGVGSEVTDGEGISWLFFKPGHGGSPAGIEFNELFYYY